MKNRKFRCPKCRNSLLVPNTSIGQTTICPTCSAKLKIPNHESSAPSATHSRSEAANGSGQYKKCPYCREQILADAIKCKHCGSSLDGGSAPVSSGGFSNIELLEVAKMQKALQWMVLFNVGVIILCALFFRVLTSIFPCFFQVIWPVGSSLALVFIYRLSKALKYKPFQVWLDVILVWLPIFNLVILVGRVMDATAVLKQKGIRVGLMGANRHDLRRLVRQDEPEIGRDASPSANERR